MVPSLPLESDLGSLLTGQPLLSLSLAQVSKSRRREQDFHATMLGFLLHWRSLGHCVHRVAFLHTASRWLRGLLFVSLWYGSICAGWLFLYCPLLPLLLVHQRLFRQLTDIVFATWEIYPTALLECVLGIRIVVNGDPVDARERSLLIMNHRTRTDWNFLWAAMFHASQPMAHRMKFVLKDPIRHIPGPGWVMQLTCFMFIRRNWQHDQHLLAKTLDYLADIKHTYQILLFPEGTDLTESSRQRSDQYATTHSLRHYTFVLHPKTTGFVFLVQRMRQNNQLDAVYDMTVGYPFHIPQQETDLLRGNFPQEVHFNIKRFPNTSLPTGDTELRQWLADIWCEKERVLHDFYMQGSFKENAISTSDPSDKLSLQNNSTDGNVSSINCKSHQYTLPSPDYSQLETVPSCMDLPQFKEKAKPKSEGQEKHFNHSSALYLSLMFWTMLSFLLLLGLMLSQVVQIWVAANCILFVCLSIFTQGTHLIEISLFRLKQKYFLKP